MVQIEAVISQLKSHKHWEVEDLLLKMNTQALKSYYCMLPLLLILSTQCDETVP